MGTLDDRAAAAWALLRQRRGAITEIALGLGIQPQAVWQWQVVPLHRLYDVARIAQTPWRELRPDCGDMSGRMIKLLARRHNGAARRCVHRKTPKAQIKSDLKSKRTRLSTTRA